MQFHKSLSLAPIIPLLLIGLVTTAQSLSAFNEFVPAGMVDARSGISKNVLGMGAYAQVAINAGVKQTEGCSDSDYGRLQIEFFWYNDADEGGKMMLKMMKDMNGAEAQKNDFLGRESGDDHQTISEELAGGTLRYNTSAKPCINTISGATGKTEYSTKAKYFAFTGNLVIKTELSAKIKPETAKSLIEHIASRAKDFNFSAYKTIVAQGKD